MKIGKKFLIYGLVQGVGYRYFVHKNANLVGVYGYVKNLYDGSVEVYAIGTEEQLDKFKSKLLTGPSYSRVDNVIEENSEVISSFRSFFIKD
jgi:acylphosphatase